MQRLHLYNQTLVCWWKILPPKFTVETWPQHLCKGTTIQGDCVIRKKREARKQSTGFKILVANTQLNLFGAGQEDSSHLFTFLLKGNHLQTMPVLGCKPEFGGWVRESRDTSSKPGSCGSPSGVSRVQRPGEGTVYRSGSSPPFWEPKQEEFQWGDRDFLSKQSGHFRILTESSKDGFHWHVLTNEYSTHWRQRDVFREGT